jgi:tripartite-type tricarboxylate transporter receptor subunit TctC
MTMPVFFRRVAAGAKLSAFAVLAAFAASPSTAAPRGAAAAGWPHEKPMAWIVGFPPGGTADTLTRRAAVLLSRKTGQPVVVENRAGASGAVAVQAAASAAADGYTMVTMAGPGIDAQGTPALGNGLQPVAMLAKGPMVLVGPMANAPPADLQALLAEARRNPKAWSYATSGTGTPQHLAGELLNRLAGTSILHVPYKGGAQAVGGVVGGQVPLAMLGVMPLLPYIASGKVKAYAVTSASRLRATLPDVPTMQEAGLADYDISQWNLVAVAEKVPSARVAQLNRWINEIMTSREMKEALRVTGCVPLEGSPAFVSSFVRAEDEKWRAFARAVGIAK